jgi:hypothetical protein
VAGGGFTFNRLPSSCEEASRCRNWGRGHFDRRALLRKRT